jgi:acyl-CoA thioesterase
MPIKGVDPKTLPERFRPMFESNPFADHFDLEVVSLSPGEAVLRFPYRKEFTQYQGSVQGGIVVSYADAAMAVAIAPLIEEGRDFVTTDLSVQFVRAGTAGPFLARATVEHQGKTLLRGRASVEIENIGFVAYCMATFMVVSPRRPSK